MSEPAAILIRKECPPGACDCGRDALLQDPCGDLRILRLTRQEEKKLLARIEAISTYPDLQKIVERMAAGMDCRSFLHSPGRDSS